MKINRALFSFLIMMFFEFLIAVVFFLYRVANKRIWKEKSDCGKKKEKPLVFRTFSCPPTPVKLSEIDLDQIRLLPSVTKGPLYAHDYFVNEITYKDQTPLIVTFEPTSVHYRSSLFNNSPVIGARMNLTSSQKDKFLEILKKIQYLARSIGIYTGNHTRMVRNIDREITSFAYRTPYMRVKLISTQKIVEIRDTVKREVNVSFRHIYNSEIATSIIKSLDPSPGIWKGIKEEINAQITDEFQATPPYNVLDVIQYL